MLAFFSRGMVLHISLIDSDIDLARNLVIPTELVVMVRIYHHDEVLSSMVKVVPASLSHGHAGSGFHEMDDKATGPCRRWNIFGGVRSTAAVDTSYAQDLDQSLKGRQIATARGATFHVIIGRRHRASTASGFRTDFVVGALALARVEVVRVSVCAVFASCGREGEAKQAEPAAARRIGTRVMAWWRARVVAPVRRAWLAVAAARARSRNGERGILNLHQDVQTCGYEDVQVMWNMLSSEKEAAPPPPPAPRKRAFWRLRLPVWPAAVWSPRGRGMQQREPNPTAACNFAM
uniref:Uncharacterized protein n=1 Tax=Oryza punctata TaxID=4537 RepID=A0A0E0LE88_ORYPU